MYVNRRRAFIVFEAVALGERIKPVQEAVRRVLYRHRIRDEKLFKSITGLVYSIFRNYGLVDYVVRETIGIDLGRLSPWERGVVRTIGYIRFFDKLLSIREKKRFYKYALMYLEKKGAGGRTRLRSDQLYLLTSASWSPRNRFEEIMIRYRISIELYMALDKAFRELEEDLGDFLEYSLKPWRHHVFRVNSLKASLEAIYNHLRDLGYRVERGRYSRQALRIYGSLGREVVRFIETGVLIPQDESSMVAIELLPLEDTVEIADLCAAPGGKTTYLAEKTRPKTRIHAFDVNRDRVKRLRTLLERTGVSKAVRVYHRDAREAPEILGGNSMDMVVVDPPCSSTGAIARNPDVRWRYNEEEIKEITRLQQQLLETAYKITKSGGYILYTTCSLLPWEGEYIVKKIIEKHGDLEIVKLSKPFKQSPILPQTIRSYPHIHHVIGFYYALLRKR